MYQYLIAFIIIMIMYAFYSNELNYVYNTASQVSDNKYLSDLSNYYRYHMI